MGFKLNTPTPTGVEQVQKAFINVGDNEADKRHRYGNKKKDEPSSRETGHITTNSYGGGTTHSKKRQREVEKLAAGQDGSEKGKDRTGDELIDVERPGIEQALLQSRRKNRQGR